jgi:hypothetical protein
MAGSVEKTGGIKGFKKKRNVMQTRSIPQLADARYAGLSAGDVNSTRKI